MADTQHTPGPWVFDLSKSWRPHRVSLYHFVGNDDADIAHIGENFSSNRSPAETIANARLIAAAPELLAACQRALAEAVADDQDGWFANMRAAIAKATGQ